MWGVKKSKHGPLGVIPTFISSSQTQNTNQDLSLLYALFVSLGTEYICILYQEGFQVPILELPISIYINPETVFIVCMLHLSFMSAGGLCIVAEDKEHVYRPNGLEQWLNKPLAFSLAGTRAFC